jgi:PTS system ascorbate-specific IIA component
MNLIEYLITQKNIIPQAQADDWKSAIKISTDILVKSGAIEPRYYDEIIKNANDNGPYFVIAPGIAMPHARPECGVKRTGYSLVTLKKPIEFGHDDNDPVDVILTIAAIDKKALNEEVIVQVMTLFESEELILKLKSAQNIDEIINVLKNVPLSEMMN